MADNLNNGMNSQNNGFYNNSNMQNNNYQSNSNNKVNNKFALSSLICGILSIWVFGIPFGLTAIILGIIGLNTFDLATEKNESFAIAGIIIGVIAVLICTMNLMTYY